MNFNKIFCTAENCVFTRINANKAEGFQGNYITVIDGKAIAVVDGEEVPMPKVLINKTLAIKDVGAMLILGSRIAAQWL